MVIAHLFWGRFRRGYLELIKQTNFFLIFLVDQYLGNWLKVNFTVTYFVIAWNFLWNILPNAALYKTAVVVKKNSSASSQWTIS